MKILYIAPTDPRLTAYGGQQRTHVIWEGLKNIPDAEVSTVVPVPHKSLEREDATDRVYLLCLEKRYSLGWIVQRLLKKFIPYWDCSWAYNWKSLYRRFADADVVVCRYVKCAAAFKAWKIAPLYLDADDIHTMEFDLQTKVCGNSIKRRIQRWLLGRYQFGVYKKARKIWVPAPEQLSLFPNYPIACLPNIPCPPLPDVAGVSCNKNKLLFIGLMSADSNQIAIDSFLSMHWQNIREKFPDLELDIAGAGLPQRYENKWAIYKGVNLLGFVKDIRPLYAEAMAFIAPMQIGMGSCIKVLESLAMGLPVIATVRGLRGLSTEMISEENGLYCYKNTDQLIGAIASFRKQDECSVVGRRNKFIDFVNANFSQSKVNEICRTTLVKGEL